MVEKKIILECQGLKKYYGNACALKQIDLSLEQGKIIGLLGPNGSGKTTLIKLANGLLTPSEGHIYVKGMEPGIETKKIVSYLPDRNYLNNWMKVNDLIKLFDEMYENFNKDKALAMLQKLNIALDARLKTLSKGNKEKVQLILVMSREADLYILDEPIAGVDPAARDYVLHTIINNYNTEGTILIATHLIADIENILDEAIFINRGEIVLHSSVDDIREERGKSVDGLFREVFKC